MNKHPRSLRNITPFGPPMRYPNCDRELSSEFPDEDTSPGDQATTVYQQLLLIFDGLRQLDRERLLCIASSFIEMSTTQREVLTTAAEHMAGHK